MKYYIFLLTSSFVFCQTQMKPEETEVWNPEPEKVIPGTLNSAPSDAIILFDGTNFSKWKSTVQNQPIKWTLNSDKSMTVKPGSGGIESIDEHGSIQLHLEWKTPTSIKSKGQGRGNSGIFFQRRFEVQILDSYENRTYSNGQAGSIYKQHIPLVNATLPPGKWQTYDIIFIEPQYNELGDEIKAGSFTVFHNGILIQNSVEILGTVEYIGKPKKGRDVMPGLENGQLKHRSLLLQDHGNLVSFKNIWMRKI